MAKSCRTVCGRTCNVRVAALAVLALVQVTLATAAWMDLAHRSTVAVRGPKWRWALVIVVNFVGPLAYFAFGRVHGGRQPASG